VVDINFSDKLPHFPVLLFIALLEFRGIVATLTRVFARHVHISPTTACDSYDVFSVTLTESGVGYRLNMTARKTEELNGEALRNAE
jgi:hypothetical protein